MKTSPNDVSNQEILKKLDRLSDTVGGLSDKVGSLSNKIDTVHTETMEAIHELADQTDGRFMIIERRLNRVESQMVTKDYLDDKLADLKSDLRQDTAKQIQKALN